MKNKKRMVSLIKKINRSFEESAMLREEMLSPKKMIGASLIKRYLGTKNHKRTSAAFYLSLSIDGKTKLKYVSKREVSSVKIHVAEWKKYQQDLKRWRQLSSGIWQDLKQSGNLQDQLKGK